jgi:protein O-mannosyl-transferase
VFRRPHFSVLFIFVATLLSYLPAMRNSFVWDDTALILRDPLVRHWRLIPDGFREFLFLDATASNFYRPVQRLTFTADYALWGINRESSTNSRTNAPDTGDTADQAAILAAPQPGWHLTSVLIHALAACALLAFLRIWLGENGGVWAFAGALLWAIHPLHTSAVTYVSGRADPLAALFVFSALALIARSHAGGGLRPGDRVGAWRVMGAAALCLLALLSKEAGVAGLILWFVWVAGNARRSRLSWLAFGCAALLVTVIYFSMRNAADRTPPPASKTTTTMVERAGLMTRALAEYTLVFVAPQRLHMERNISKTPVSQVVAGCAVFAALAAWALWARRRAPQVLIALACAAVTWLPVSNLFTLNSTMAEHWLYLPSAFLLAALVITARCFPHRWIPFAAAGWLAFLGIQTWSQQSYWRDQRTFFTETAERSGRSKRMLGNLAGLELENGHVDDAKKFLAAAIKEDPEYAGFQLMKAGIALSEKDAAAAAQALEIAGRDPFFAAEVMVLTAGLDMQKTGRPRLDLLAQAAARSLRNWSIVRKYPLTLESINRNSEAYSDLLRSMHTHGYRAEGWRMLARVAEKMNQRAIAVRAYGEAANRDCRDDFSRAKIRELQGVQ